MTTQPYEITHAPRCGCLACRARSWLRYTWPGDAIIPGLKIATYGGAGGGTGEPDRHLADPVVAEADFVLALLGLPDSLVKAAGIAARTVPPRRIAEPDKAIARPARLVMQHLRRTRWGEWAAVREARSEETERDTLEWLLEECAKAMAAAMGEPAVGRLRERVVPAAPEGVQ